MELVLKKHVLIPKRSFWLVELRIRIVFKKFTCNGGIGPFRHYFEIYLYCIKYNLKNGIEKIVQEHDETFFNCILYTRILM